MGLETFTGKVSDLVETNPPGTDPKSQGDDHIRGIKKTIIGQAIKTQVGQHATASENHFFDGRVPNELTLKRGTPDVPGAELIKALNGVLSFPNQAQSLSENGYVKLPGGLIIQWGFDPSDTNGNLPLTFPVAFPNLMLSLQAHAVSSNGLYTTHRDNTLTTVLIQLWANNTTQAPDIGINWLAIGY